MAIPLLDAIAIEGKDITADALLTQRKLARYLDFPHVGQAYLIEREAIHEKNGKHSRELAYGITSRTPAQADAKRLLQINRGPLVIENSYHYIINWNYGEDRSRIRTGHGPET